MITRNDCIILLTDLESKGIDVKEQLDKTLKSNEVSMSVIKFINDNRQLDLTEFYKHIRKSYNNKHSSLYINIVKEIEDTNEVLTTLSALLTQILLFSKKSNDRQMFLKHARFNEITKALNIYSTTYDLTICLKLLRIIKVDLKACEQLYR